jgi:hypothetical protein
MACQSNPRVTTPLCHTPGLEYVVLLVLGLRPESSGRLESNRQHVAGERTQKNYTTECFVRRLRYRLSYQDDFPGLHFPTHRAWNSSAPDVVPMLTYCQWGRHATRLRKMSLGWTKAQPSVSRCHHDVARRRSTQTV